MLTPRAWARWLHCAVGILLLRGGVQVDVQQQTGSSKRVVAGSSRLARSSGMPSM